jgi:hypothetical protein
MVTVKQLIQKLSEYDENDIVTIDAYNGDGSAESNLTVNGNIIADLVDYYNSNELEIVV